MFKFMGMNDINSETTTSSVDVKGLAGDALFVQWVRFHLIKLDILNGEKCQPWELNLDFLAISILNET